MAEKVTLMDGQTDEFDPVELQQTIGEAVDYLKKVRLCLPSLAEELWGGAAHPLEELVKLAEGLGLVGQLLESVVIVRGMNWHTWQIADRPAMGIIAGFNSTLLEVVSALEQGDHLVLSDLMIEDLPAAIYNYQLLLQELQVQME